MGAKNNVNNVQSGNNLSERLNIIKKITNTRKFTERQREMPSSDLESVKNRPYIPDNKQSRTKSK